MPDMLEFNDAAARALEAVYLTPDVVAQRTRVLDLLQPRPGEAIVDIGVGPGLLALDLAKMVGEHGRVVGFDTSEPMLRMARTRLAALPQASMEQGDAVALPFEAASFDAMVSTQVYEYVADMKTALNEVVRILKPGGRTVILDTDWRSIVWHTEDKTRMEKMLEIWDDHLADPHLPATLGAKLERAGLRVEKVEVVPMLSAGWQPHSYAAGISRQIRRFVGDNAERHGVKQSEVDAWFDEQMQLAERGGFFFSVNRYAFLARKPG